MEKKFDAELLLFCLLPIGVKSQTYSQLIHDKFKVVFDNFQKRNSQTVKEQNDFEKNILTDRKKSSTTRQKSKYCFKDRVNLILLKTKTFDCGAVTLYYESAKK